MTGEKRQTQHNVDLPYTMRKLEPLAPLYKPHVTVTMLMSNSPALSAKAPARVRYDMKKAMEPIGPSISRFHPMLTHRKRLKMSACPSK